MLSISNFSRHPIVRIYKFWNNGHLERLFIFVLSINCGSIWNLLFKRLLHTIEYRQWNKKNDVRIQSHMLLAVRRRFYLDIFTYICPIHYLYKELLYKENIGWCMFEYLSSEKLHNTFLYTWYANLVYSAEGCEAPCGLSQISQPYIYRIVSKTHVLITCFSLFPPNSWSGMIFLRGVLN